MTDATGDPAALARKRWRKLDESVAGMIRHHRSMLSVGPLFGSRAKKDRARAYETGRLEGLLAVRGEMRRIARTK